MSPKTASIVAEVVAEFERRCHENFPSIVAVDGRGGAGKSSFARSLVAAISGAIHIEHDWFHLPKDQVTPARRFDHNRLLREVIEPFKSGTQSLKFLRYNWGFLTDAKDGFDADPVVVENARTLVIEGCETLDPELSPHYGLRVWIDTDPAESLRRGVQRDIEEYKLNPSRVHDCWREWVVREEQALHIDNRRERADIAFK